MAASCPIAESTLSLALNGLDILLLCYHLYWHDYAVYLPDQKHGRDWPTPCPCPLNLTSMQTLTADGASSSLAEQRLARQLNKV